MGRAREDDELDITCCIVGAIETNCYIVSNDSGKCCIIDPGADASILIRTIEQKKLIPECVVNTHGHYDHIGANKDIADYFHIPVWCHVNDAPMLTDAGLNFSSYSGRAIMSPAPERLLYDAEEIQLAGVLWKVLHTPGHTKGSIVLYSEQTRCMFTGDTLFNEDFGRTDLPGGSEKELHTSLLKIAALDGDFTIYPGHGESALLSEQRPVIAHYCK